MSENGFLNHSHTMFCYIEGEEERGATWAKCLHQFLVLVKKWAFSVSVKRKHPQYCNTESLLNHVQKGRETCSNFNLFIAGSLTGNCSHRNTCKRNMWKLQYDLADLDHHIKTKLKLHYKPCLITSLFFCFPETYFPETMLLYFLEVLFLQSNVLCSIWLS